jgi:hypothetical protein
MASGRDVLDGELPRHSLPVHRVPGAARMNRTAHMEATLDVIGDAANITPRTVVAAPPSSMDAVSDLMRVFVDGIQIERAFDPGSPIEEGAVHNYVTEDGDYYVTEDGDNYVAQIAQE